MPLIVDIALATLCIIGDGSYTEERCFPVLIGGTTPKGEYQLQQRLTEAKGYGGDVLQFREDELEVFAIHRVWLGRPWEKRAERLKNPDAKARRITMGCINVDPEVYEELVNCCSTSTLIIK